MMYIAENLRALRRGKGLTQEEVAETLGLSAQSVSKWERGETLPDITLLPVLANLFAVSTDELIGMDKINDSEALGKVFSEGHSLMRLGKNHEAAVLYANALKTYPNNHGLMADLAMAQALGGTADGAEQAIALCKRVLAEEDAAMAKIRHTARAALCFVHLLAGDKDAAIATAKNLPHTRESREVIMEQIEQGMEPAEVAACLLRVAVGEVE